MPRIKSQTPHQMIYNTRPPPPLGFLLWRWCLTMRTPHSCGLPAPSKLAILFVRDSYPLSSKTKLFNLAQQTPQLSLCIFHIST